MELIKRLSSDINNKNIENTTNSEVFSIHNVTKIDTVDGMEERGSKFHGFHLLTWQNCCSRIWGSHFLLETIHDIVPYVFA